MCVAVGRSRKSCVHPCLIAPPPWRAPIIRRAFARAAVAAASSSPTSLCVPSSLLLHHRANSTRADTTIARASTAEPGASRQS